MRAEELLAERDHVLVAFDGPVAELPAGDGMAGRLRVMLGDAKPPRKVERTDDPYVVLAHAAAIGPATERAVHTQLCRLEAEMVAAARLAPGVLSAFARLAAAGTRITVVGGLAADPIRAFLVVHGLDEHVRRLAGRTGPDRMTPGMITAAIRELVVPLEACAFVGSTDNDIAAAREAGVDVVRYRRPSEELPWFDAVAQV
ncbi:HAD family hydrolase [Amycolatopsis sp. YIM 10]|uniref:HAD family hydrolase n=1 Tax=Amycolatopsis sp. YIM 10 TaxID=2653857 RepID=UPI00128FD89A|nr:HAD family hydrolase [Amycolatopsis sp. YIM 10]QFU92168.1 Phosphoglycolate phosphatase [Amycolatopsis sp. YIM 10]